MSNDVLNRMNRELLISQGALRDTEKKLQEKSEMTEKELKALEILKRAFVMRVFELADYFEDGMYYITDNSHDNIIEITKEEYELLREVLGHAQHIQRTARPRKAS